MATFPNYRTLAAEDLDVIDGFPQEYDSIDDLFEEPGATEEGDVSMDDAADAECDGDAADEEYSSDEDGDYELDESTAAAPSGNNINTTNSHANNSTTNNNNNDNNNNHDEDGDTAMDDHHPQQQQQQRQEEEWPTPEEVEEWQNQKLEILHKNMASTRARIDKFNEKIAAEQSAIDSKQAEHDREWEARNMGEHELQQIIAAKKKLKEQLEKKQTNLQKSVEKIGVLEKEEQDVLSHPREEYIKAMKKAGRRRKTRNTAQSQTDPFYRLDEGDDSLSEQEGPPFRTSSRKKRKNAASACRRCKTNKVKCDMKRGQCTHCRLLNKRCRYNDPWDSSRQLRPFQLLETEEKLEQSQAQVAYYQQMSMASALADNPLSGITGYGPRTVTAARQNYARLNRGMDPIARAPLSANITATGGQDAALAASSNQNQNVSFPQQPRQVVAPLNPTVRAQLAPPASQREVGTYWIHQTVPPTVPAKRGRKPGQKTTKTTKQQQRVSEYNTHLPAHHQVSQQGTNPSIENMQGWWRRQTLSSGRRIPVNPDLTPKWPWWIFLSNEKQRLWFDYMVNAQREIPLVVGTGRQDVLQPRWPGWTTVMEAPLGEARAGYVLSLLRQGQEVKEIMDLNGTGQGKIDWQFYLSA